MSSEKLKQMITNKIKCLDLKDSLNILETIIEDKKLIIIKH